MKYYSLYELNWIIDLTIRIELDRGISNYSYYPKVSVVGARLGVNS
jgi:hypothetical protein